MTTTRALVIDDDPGTLYALAELVGGEGFETVTADTLAQAREALAVKHCDVVLTDLMLPDGKGTEFLAELRDQAADLECILVTGNASVETAVEALRLGAYDYLTKPVDIARLKTLLAGVKRTRELKGEVRALRAELREMGRFGRLVGTSDPMQKIYDLVSRVAPTDATVLITGESGTGKELVAETVHQLSGRRGKPFLPVNCGAVAANLIESELFGHERGAFTGADRRHPGLFERSDGGTLFLDEVTEMPLDLQVKLLRVLETGILRRVGGTKEIPVDVRVVAATNRDPHQAVDDGKLREDLLYRLQVFPVNLPPLRQRAGDIELLADFFLLELNRKEKTRKRLSTESLEHLQRYPWPGNVRELKNTIQRAYILADEVIDPVCLPQALLSDVAPMPGGPHLHVKVGASIAEVEKRLILATLDMVDGDKRSAAETLGISLKTLYNRLNAYEEEDREQKVS